MAIRTGTHALNQEARGADNRPTGERNAAALTPTTGLEETSAAVRDTWGEEEEWDFPLPDCFSAESYAALTDQQRTKFTADYDKTIVFTNGDPEQAFRILKSEIERRVWLRQ